MGTVPAKAAEVNSSTKPSTDSKPLSRSRLHQQRLDATAREHAEHAAGGLTWSYDEQKDEMGGGVVQYASLRSLNETEFDFPYAGPQRATLTLRRHPTYGRDVLLAIERGQFIVDVTQGGTVRVRFDDGPARSFEIHEPQDYDTKTVFIEGFSRFLAGARSAKKLAIEAQFYQEGTRVFTFDCSGLKW